MVTLHKTKGNGCSDHWKKIICMSATAQVIKVGFLKRYHIKSKTKL